MALVEKWWFDRLTIKRVGLTWFCYHAWNFTSKSRKRVCLKTEYIYIYIHPRIAIYDL